ncbi:hypothetical protein Pla108_14580 [Botrimarina colliarenosi]|uniref:Uncharacterized protein n=1 Tax=Botrimarina colliarenosi TaxID=2528001 RepID=A0A5C6AN20_9BACT|nr:hypothetical protein [Botrimarina colliarenosi]TWU00506.1 hypothetical protein Pla108_14580 [Botrimarina colliarenosi]
MRALLALVVIAIVLALLGWVTFNVSGDSASATVESEKIERDIDNVSQSFKDAGTAVESSLDRPAAEPDEVPPAPIER